MELASLLAGERFSDRPAGVCPVLAAFLRGYNDGLPDATRHTALVRRAADVVGTRATDGPAAEDRAALVEAFARRRLGRWARAGWRHQQEREWRVEYLGGRCGRWAGADPQRHAAVDALLDALVTAAGGVGRGSLTENRCAADLDACGVDMDGCRIGRGVSVVDHVICASARTPSTPAPCIASAGERSWS